MSRDLLIRCRLLCPHCSIVEQVADVSDNRYSVRLRCSHQRTTATLPSKEGCVSYELADTPEGLRLFPAQRDGYGTTALDRERWIA